MTGPRKRREQTELSDTPLQQVAAHQRPTEADLFDRVVAILEQARARTARAVHSEMVLAYFHIGREIVQQIQRGDARAEYGQRVIEELSAQLTQRYGRGYSTTNLRYFRTFYVTYCRRKPQIRHIPGGESQQVADTLAPDSVSLDLARATQLAEDSLGFSPLLGWSHYRVLMKVNSEPERRFYELEAEKEGWDVEQLERQIHTLLFARLLKSRDKAGVIELASQGQRIERPIDTLRDPYVLDFLSLPSHHKLRESDLEEAIIDKLQSFLLELGKGFAFVSRQKRLQYDDEFFFVDLVFYHCILKCYVLIDLKMGKLTHQDVGQMDSYVRLFDEKYTTEGDNPTVGLILCAEKNAAVARYSVLHESKQIFAAKYVTYLPTEEELQRELRRERQILEDLSQPSKESL
jgi:predicted nuclease of restriction endonuclease-like (RecB) superfamily